MGKTSTYGVKCPTCETMVVDKVDKADLKAGRAVLTCHYCGQQIRLGQPKPFLWLLLDPYKSFPYELMILIILTSFLYPYATDRLHLDSQYVIGFLVIPYIIAIGLGVRRFIRKEWGKYGRLRLPRRPPGSTIKNAVPVHSVHEEYNFLDLQRCPICKGTLKIKNHSMISTSALRLFLSQFLGREFIKLRDKIIVECQNCEIHLAFYFNIDQIPYVRELGVTEELAVTHMKLAVQEQTLREK